MSTVLTIVLIAFVVLTGFMFVRKWYEDGFEAAKGWAAGLLASLTGAAADWWEPIQGVFQ